jgi:dynein intermediate chain 1
MICYAPLHPTTQAKTLVKPSNQLALSDKQLEEEFTRILNANDPLAPQNIARYNNKERIFKTSLYVEHLVTHYEFDGYINFKSDTEDLLAAVLESNKAAANGEQQDHRAAATTTTTTTTVVEGLDGVEEVVIVTTAPSKGRNQFNYSERAAQTLNNPYRVGSGAESAWAGRRVVF